MAPCSARWPPSPLKSSTRSVPPFCVSLGTQASRAVTLASRQQSGDLVTLMVPGLEGQRGDWAGAANRGPHRDEQAQGKLGTSLHPGRGTEGCEQSRGTPDAGQGRTTASCPRQKDPCVHRTVGQGAWPGLGSPEGALQEAGSWRDTPSFRGPSHLGSPPACLLSGPARVLLWEPRGMFNRAAQSGGSELAGPPPHTHTQADGALGIGPPP